MKQSTTQPKKNETPHCDEFVVFNKSQTLPRFWVEFLMWKFAMSFYQKTYIKNVFCMILIDYQFLPILI